MMRNYYDLCHTIAYRISIQRYILFNYFYEVKTMYSRDR